MENKNWHKKINTIAFTFVACLPIFIFMFDLFRNGYNLEDNQLNTIFGYFQANPITSVLSSTLTIAFNVTDLPNLIISVCFGWFLFVELFEIVVMALFYFISVLKDFFDRKENKIL